MSWRYVIVHHSATRDGSVLADTEAIRRYHMTPESEGGPRGGPWLDIGYHFVCELVDSEYVVVPGRSLGIPGSHARGYNDVAIGVCLVGNFTAAEPPREQLAVAARLVAGLADAHAVPEGNILPHRAVGETSCPGDAFPWAEFLAMVAAERAS